MNKLEKKNVSFRIISTLLLITPIVFAIIFLIAFMQRGANKYGIELATEFILVLFTAIEIMLLLKKPKNELSLQNIAFNENKKVNRPALVVVIGGSIIGAGLLVLGICLFFLKSGDKEQATAMITIPVAIFLLINCIIYFLYLVFYHERKFKLEDLLK